jgi:hypothetical protein
VIIGSVASEFGSPGARLVGRRVVTVVEVGAVDDRVGGVEAGEVSLVGERRVPVAKQVGQRRQR